MGIASVQLNAMNGRGNQHHLKNPKSKAEEMALIAGGEKVRFQNTAISKAEEIENMRAARARQARKSNAKVSLPKLPWE